MKTIPLLFLVALAASGKVTYTYTGNQFDSVTYWPVSPASTGTHVTAIVTLPMALPKGATTCIASRTVPCSSPVINLNGFSWDITDGVSTIAQVPGGTSGAILNSLTFTTDANGNIVNWNMDASNGSDQVEGVYLAQILEIRTTNEPAPGFENDSDVSITAYGMESISGDSGSWTVNDPVGAVVTGATGYVSIAAGGLATIYGNFKNFPTVTGTGTTLGGVQVTFPGITSGGAPLFYVSSTQITFQVPWELQANTSKQTPLSVTLNGQQVAAVLLSALPVVAPGVFELNTQHQAAALDVSSKPIGPNNPTQAGSAVSIYCTGLGPVNVAQTDGVPAPVDQLVYTTNQPTVTIGGQTAQVLFSGLAPGATGLYQIDAVVPNVPSGTQPLTVTVLNVASNTTTLAVQ